MQQGMRAFNPGQSSFPNGSGVLAAMQSSAAQRQAGVALINENLQRLSQQIRMDKQLAAEEEQQKARQAALKQGRQMLDKSVETFSAPRSRMTALGSVLGSMDQGQRTGYLESEYGLSSRDAGTVLRMLNEEKSYRIYNPEAMAAVYRLYTDAGMSPEDAKREIELATEGASVSHADASMDETEEVIGLIDRFRGINSESRERRREQQAAASELDAFRGAAAQAYQAGALGVQQFDAQVPMLPEQTPNREANQAFLDQPQQALALDPTALLGLMAGAQSPDQFRALQQLQQQVPSEADVQSDVNRSAGAYFEQSLRSPFAGVPDSAVGLQGDVPLQSPLLSQPVPLNSLDTSGLPGMAGLKSIGDKITARAVAGPDGSPMIDLQIPDYMRGTKFEKQVQAAEAMLTGSAAKEFLLDNSNFKGMSVGQGAALLPPLPGPALSEQDAPVVQDPWATYKNVNP